MSAKSPHTGGDICSDAGCKVSRAVCGHIVFYL